jgi:Flp pilus assembly protein TadD
MMKKHLSLLLLPLLLLAACNDTMRDPINSMSGMKKETEARLSTRAAEEIANGKTREALATYKRLYADKPQSKEVALNYAQLLRRSGQRAEAIKVLRKFTGADTPKSPGKEPMDALLLNEYAAALIEDGDFNTAATALAAVQDSADARHAHADAYNLSGIVLDAQGKHSEAEQMFRQSMETWRGDKSSVMNNLALSLASQGKFDESIDQLRRALMLAPGKTEIARNIDIVSALRHSIVPQAPVNLRGKKSAQMSPRPAKKPSRIQTP